MVDEYEEEVYDDTQEKEDDIYDKEDLEDDDEISPQEAAFMEGYKEAGKGKKEEE